MTASYDIIIIGGGPAGLTAALYAGRARMKTLLLERALSGGQALITDTIENFPGFPEGVKGPELAELISKQALRFGVETKTVDVVAIIPGKAPSEPFFIRLEDGGSISGLAVIVATGARWNTLGIPGENELSGKGVSYCATCDGPLFKNKEVVVVGGGDTAIEDALFLAKFASKVTVVHRRDKLRATKILQERASANKKIELCLESVAVEVLGKSRVDGLKVKDVKSGKESAIKASGIFVLIGVTPNSDIVKGVVRLDEKGHVLTDDEMRTSAEGIFAAGDVRKKLLRQIVTATGDGATAAFTAEHYVDSLKGTAYQ